MADISDEDVAALKHLRWLLDQSNRGIISGHPNLAPSPEELRAVRLLSRLIANANAKGE